VLVVDDEEMMDVPGHRLVAKHLSGHIAIHSGRQTKDIKHHQHHDEICMDKEENRQDIHVGGFSTLPVSCCGLDPWLPPYVLSDSL